MRERRMFLRAMLFTAVALALFESVSLAAAQKRTGAKPTEKAGQMSKEKKAASESPIMCVLGSLDQKQLKRHQELRQQLRDKTQEVRELDAGYALRLPNENGMILSVAEFITLERQCCPFFSFAIEVEGEQGSLWLKLTGRDGVKEFLKSQLLDK